MTHIELSEFALNLHWGFLDIAICES